MPKEFIVVMEKLYPFGELGEVITEDTKTLVKKTLKFINMDERQIIYNMIHFMKAARHQSLINIEKILEGSDEVQLYYEYAPFKLQKWIATVNEDLLESLEVQMIQLAEYLTRSSIKFTFDPNSIGLCQEMKIKYFLNQFSIDFQDQEEHFEQLKINIRKFFKELTSDPSSNEEYAKQCCLMDSLSTNPSISPLDEFITLKSQILKKSEEKGLKKAQLSSKVESSMKKSLQVLLRFKKMNLK